MSRARPDLPAPRISFCTPVQIVGTRCLECWAKRVPQTAPRSRTTTDSDEIHCICSYPQTVVGWVW
ncbi:hypothetical protein BD289DRAFT_47398 [Coniella lustricola]|uniref:Uncharacterized protein n=1 Tax=Coniella lustricola TaxID=2025994 RepID=A0A2T3AIG1_9PEZI|nr:hypothetical protein BD289DRAFT_47398 [Coniella lustricola]